MVDVEAVRGVLIGAQVRGLGRAVDMGVLEISGPRGEGVSVHLQCPFRVQSREAVVLGSRDMNYGLKGSGPKAFDNFATIYDERAKLLSALLEQKTATIEDVRVSGAGDLTITWLPDYSLTAYIDTSGRIESWRVLVKGGEHHVFPAEAPDA